ncbi:MAG TPA: hypothetical protein VHC22_19995 [Pirellulales bacterium]|nr:hypothetical protein [Pirellulales bacterium]
MFRRFTLADLLLWVTFVALVLAIVVPLWRHRQRTMAMVDRVTAVAASADGLTLASLQGDGRLFVWNGQGDQKTMLQTRGRSGNGLSLLSDGQLAAISDSNWSAPRFELNVWNLGTGKLQGRFAATISTVATFSPVADVLAV